MLASIGILAGGALIVIGALTNLRGSKSPTELRWGWTAFAFAVFVLSALFGREEFLFTWAAIAVFGIGLGVALLATRTRSNWWNLAYVVGICGFAIPLGLGIGI